MAGARDQCRLSFRGGTLRLHFMCERVRGGRWRNESCRLRKVRTPQGSVLGVKLRQWMAQAPADGKCHRK